MAAPSSAHTSPSQQRRTAPRIQPSIACGPPSALMISGMVMNGPTPIMSIMFSVVALPQADAADQLGLGVSGLIVGSCPTLSRLT